MKYGIKILFFFSCAVICGGCRTYHAFYARYRAPQYLLTDDLFLEAPEKVAILPFASRNNDETGSQNAAKCRRSFYQQFSVLNFDDMEMRRCDTLLGVADLSKTERMKHGFLDVIKKIDAIGMTSILDLRTLIMQDPVNYTDLGELIEKTAGTLQTDACVAGVIRSYGRLYGVVFSTISVATRVEMRSMKTGNLLWRGQSRKRDYKLPFTWNPLDIPYLLFDIWKNSRGENLDLLAYQAYGELVETIPYVEEPSIVFVETKRAKTPVYKEPTFLTFLPWRIIKEKKRYTMLMEKDGWTKCLLDDGTEGWFLNNDVIKSIEPVASASSVKMGIR